MILDNWFNPDLVTPFLREKVEAHRTFPYHLHGIVHQESLDYNRVPVQSLVVSQGVSWHVDEWVPEPLTLLLVICNDGFSVQDKSSSATFQEVGSVILLDHHKPHRCKSLDSKRKKKWWMAVCVELFELPSRDQAESFLQMKK